VVCGGLAEQHLLLFIQQALAAAIHQAQAAVLVEGEDGDIDLAHHRAQQRSRFQRAEALLAQRAAQRVDLAHHFAQRVVVAIRAAAHGKIALAQGAEQIGKRLQREDHALAQGQNAHQPHNHDAGGDGDLRSQLVATGPEKVQRTGRAWQRRDGSQQDNTIFVTDASRLDAAHRVTQVGQTIAFRGLSGLTKTPDRRHNPIVCPTAGLQ
jgi:hypothetical protein